MTTTPRNRAAAIATAVGVAAVAVLVVSAACTPTREEPMEPWFAESQKRTIELTEQWKDARYIPGTEIYHVTHNLPVSDPYVPDLSPIPGSGATGSYSLQVSGGGGQMPEGSGKQYLWLGMTAFGPDEDTFVHCDGNAYIGQVAECGGWVIRVVEADEGDGGFELLAHPDAPGYQLMRGPEDPITH